MNIRRFRLSVVAPQTSTPLETFLNATILASPMSSSGGGYAAVYAPGSVHSPGWQDGNAWPSWITWNGAAYNNGRWNDGMPRMLWDETSKRFYAASGGHPSAAYRYLRQTMQWDCNTDRWSRPYIGLTHAGTWTNGGHNWDQHALDTDTGEFYHRPQNTSQARVCKVDARNNVWPLSAAEGAAGSGASNGAYWTDVCGFASTVTQAAMCYHPTLFGAEGGLVVFEKGNILAVTKAGVVSTLQAGYQASIAMVTAVYSPAMGAVVGGFGEGSSTSVSVYSSGNVLTNGSASAFRWDGLDISAKQAASGSVAFHRLHVLPDGRACILQHYGDWADNPSAPTRASVAILDPATRNWSLAGFSHPFLFSTWGCNATRSKDTMIGTIPNTANRSGGLVCVREVTAQASDIPKMICWRPPT